MLRRSNKRIMLIIKRFVNPVESQHWRDAALHNPCLSRLPTAKLPKLPAAPGENGAARIDGMARLTEETNGATTAPSHRPAGDVAALTSHAGGFSLAFPLSDNSSAGNFCPFPEHFPYDFNEAF